MAHLKKGASGHLLKGRNGHLVRACCPVCAVSNDVLYWDMTFFGVGWCSAGCQDFGNNVSCLRTGDLGTHTINPWTYNTGTCSGSVGSGVSLQVGTSGCANLSDFGSYQISLTAASVLSILVYVPWSYHPFIAFNGSVAIPSKAKPIRIYNSVASCGYDLANTTYYTATGGYVDLTPHCI